MQAKLWEHVRATKVVKDEVTSNVGDAAAAWARMARKSLKATYDFAIHTHGSIGPSCAVAEFKDGKLTSWSASQATHNLRKQLATMFGMPAENVRCIYIEGSGCYGRNGHEDAAADAALLAKAVGRPVRVQWSRADEHGWDPKGPPTLIDLRAAMDAGRQRHGVGIGLLHSAADRRRLQCAAHRGDARLECRRDDHTAPGNIFQNSAIPYKFAEREDGLPSAGEDAVPALLDPHAGRMQNTYANECFMDELAAAANADPLEFRLKYLDPADKRGIEVLNRVAALAKWEKRASPQARPERRRDDAAAASPTASTNWRAPMWRRSPKSRSTARPATSG